MALMQKSDAAKTAMAENSGTDLAGYKSQLAATMMFYDAKPAVDFVRGSDLEKTMKNVADFSFKHGLLGEGAADSGFIGMTFPGGKVLGSKRNIKLRFDDVYMDMAAKGAL
jgi:NitT/TauT family transport system substrate-binding protein